jgi:hypothetical protein
MRESILWTALKFRAVYFFDKNAYGGIKEGIAMFLSANSHHQKMEIDRV